ncbi:MAG: DUF6515 family protein [Steroidobacteraceae bacterium]
MASRVLLALAVLTPLATCGSALAQQQYSPPPQSGSQQGNAQPPSYPQQPSYQQPAAGYQQPPAGYQPPPAYSPPPPAYSPPPPAYSPPPPGYQPPPSYPQQRSYQPPPNYQTPGYTPQQPANYQAPANYPPPQQPAPYQPPQQPPGYGSSYPSQQQPGYSQPSGYPTQSYPAQPPNYQAPSGYPTQQQPQSYQTPAGYPAQQAPPESYRPAVPYQPPPAAYSQQAELQTSMPSQFSPYHTHVDSRYGHDRVYPDRGAITRDPPRGALTVDYAGVSYRFSDGIWFEPRGPAFVVVSAPIGLVVPSLPRSATIVTSDGQNYLYANDTYYLARPDLRGYAVVNDPLDTTPTNASLQPMPAPAPPSAPAADTERADVQIAPAPMATARAAEPASLTVASAAGNATPAPSTSSASAETSLQISPKNHQTPDEQVRDRDECYRFAVLQSGFDPVHPDGTIPLADIARRQSGFQRAAAACFEGRGYAVR